MLLAASAAALPVGCFAEGGSGAAAASSGAAEAPPSDDDTWPSDAERYLRRELHVMGWAVSNLWCDTTKCTAQLEADADEGASARAEAPAWGGVVALREAGDEGYRYEFHRNPGDHPAEGALRVSSFAWPDACENSPPVRRVPPWPPRASSLHFGRFSRRAFATFDAACRCECALKGIGEARGETVACASLESHPAQVDCRLP